MVRDKRFIEATAIALVACTPKKDGWMVGQTSDLISKFGDFKGVTTRTNAAITPEHDIFIQHNALSITCVKECIILVNTTAPNAKDIKVGRGGGLNKLTYRRCRTTSLHFLHGNHVPTARPNIGTIELEAHCKIPAPIAVDKDCWICVVHRDLWEGG